MKVSVLGCGWLGFPLAQRLTEKDYHVKGSTTSKKKLGVLQQNKIDPFLINLPASFDDEKIMPFWDCDLLFLNIPPGVRSNPDNEKDFLQTMRNTVEICENHRVSWIIFTSSTSVYSKHGGLLTEKDVIPGKASRLSGEVLIKAEKILQSSSLDTTILRLGGLYGYGRHPVRYLSGRKNLPNAAKPVHLIHQLDSLNLIMEVILQKKRKQIYNLVSDGHPPKKEFYQSAAAYYNLPLPEFDTDPVDNYAVISNEKIKKDLFYSFSYPNPMDHTP